MDEWIKQFWKELGIGLMIAIPAAIIFFSAYIVTYYELTGIELLWLKWL